MLRLEVGTEVGEIVTVGAVLGSEVGTEVGERVTVGADVGADVGILSQQSSVVSQPLLSSEGQPEWCSGVSADPGLHG